MSEAARAWVLLGHRAGDNNQLLRLASALEVPFQAIELDYNRLRVLPSRLLGATLASLTSSCRAKIVPPWPDLVLGVGNRSVPAALAIKRLSGSKARLVRLGNPRLDPSNFDLVITTPQYCVPKRPNVLRLPVGVSTAAKLEPGVEEVRWLDSLPRPHRLLLIGGDTFMWTLTPHLVAEAAAKLNLKAAAEGGSTIAVSSSRSSRAVLDAVAATLAGTPHALVWNRFPRYPVLLWDADEICVTADSVAMVSDAIATGKPVGLIEPVNDRWGRVFYGLEKLGVRVPVRDVRRFWRSILDRGLAGPVERPIAGTVEADPLLMTVSAIRSVLGDQAARPSRGSQPR